MGPHTLYIIYAAGAIVASLVAYLVYSSFKRWSMAESKKPINFFETACA